VALPEPRCVMTTLLKDGLPLDIDIPRTLVRHNRSEKLGEGGMGDRAGLLPIHTVPWELESVASLSRQTLRRQSCFERAVCVNAHARICAGAISNSHRYRDPQEREESLAAD
jgi:hypothetical protein